ncbi:MAG TPA: hypothetical protein K8W01_17895 [Methylorubrum populi]|uniref:Uncharacterized protein n=1 Tax=Methylorubrum populi TaxID=223967 RepID=A0A921E5L7_9HYPH|nr:hypothetical protein [Methylorubrum populi]
MTTIPEQDSSTSCAPRLPDGCSLADENDIWLRHIIEAKATRVEEPRLKAQYIQRKLELVTDRPWQAEISGRLLSIANDVSEKAEAAANASESESIKFRHVASVAVATVRQNKLLDVVHEPKKDDPAHSNIVAYNVPMAPLLNDQAVPKVSQEFIKKLCDSFRVDDADNLTALHAMRSEVISKSQAPSTNSTSEPPAASQLQQFVPVARLFPTTE